MKHCQRRNQQKCTNMSTINLRMRTFRAHVLHTGDFKIMAFKWAGYDNAENLRHVGRNKSYL